MIAKFAIPHARSFWGAGFDQIPETALYPRGDIILDLCTNLKTELQDELQPGDIGAFIREWANLEEYLLKKGRRVTERNVSIREAITALAKRGELQSELAMELDGLRKFRNAVVHQPKTVKADTLREWLDMTRQFGKTLRKDSE